MKFLPTPLSGAFILDIDPHHDERGYFARTWCSREFESHGLHSRMMQTSFSHNLRAGTIRGMHLQLPPSKEAKLVRCTRGRIFDVIIDLRPESPSFCCHYGLELSAEAANALYIPPLMAHGFQTLEDNCDVAYQMSDEYAPSLGFGVRWNDQRINIEWPITDGVTLLPRDKNYPDFEPDAYRQLLDQHL